MKRDLELIRDILVFIEEYDPDNSDEESNDQPVFPIDEDESSEDYYASLDRTIESDNAQFIDHFK